MMNSSKVLGRKALFVAISVVALGAGNAAFATTDSFTVSAEVIENCTVAADDLAFGNYDPIVANAASGAGDIPESADLTVTCTDGSVVSIALDNGDNFSGGRRMAKGADFLSYELYQEAGLSNVFGSGAQAVAHNGTGAAQTVTVHGNLPGGQNVPVGSYSDIIDVTISL